MPTNQAAEQSGSARESDPRAQFRAQTRERLARERGDTAAPTESPEGDQPERPARKPAAQTTPDQGEERDFQGVADDDEVQDGTESEELDADDIDGDESEEEQDESESQVEALTVDGRQFTPEDIRKLTKQLGEYDADYRRKTQVLARVRQEYQAKGQEYEAVGGFFEALSEANLRQLRSLDPQHMSQDQFTAWRNQLTAAEQGALQLKQHLDAVKQKVRKDRDAFLDQSAQESNEILRGVDPRWSNEFYSKLRDFAVKTKRYTAEEFADVTDWRTMEGLIALFDKSAAVSTINTKLDGKAVEPTQRKRRVKNRRNPQGQFQNAQQAVRESTNARADGSFRALKEQQLRAEREGRRPR
jgi:hypothetical protein